MFDYQALKKYLFKIDPEKTHKITEYALRTVKYLPICFDCLKRKNFIINNRLKQNIFGKDFLNPVGLAAGFDKNGTMIETMPALGFGSVEVGTVTPEPQPGNEKPIEDYVDLIRGFKDVCDYLVINISSPNTPGLRDLQNEAFIRTIFSTAQQITSKPILLKISPDLEASQAVNLCAIAVQNGASGIIATNTSVDYTILQNAKQIGGLSGRAIQDKSFHIFNEIAKELYGKTLLISVGGIDSGAEAYKRIKAGASLVQIYTALIFHGPSLIRKINEEIINLLSKDSFNHISEAVGVDRR